MKKGNREHVADLIDMIEAGYDVEDEGIYESSLGEVNYKIFIYYLDEFYFDVSLIGRITLEDETELELDVQEKYKLKDFLMKDDAKTVDIYHLLWQCICLEIPF